MRYRVNELISALDKIVDPDAAGEPTTDLVASEWLAATGLLAGAIEGDLAPPMETIHNMLAELVEMLDHHTATSRGPRPLPVDRLSEVRRVLTDAFLMSGRVSRLASDLAALSTGAGAPGPSEAVDVNDVVERTVALARRRLLRDQEVRISLGRPPRVETDRGKLSQLIALQLFVAAFVGGEACRVTASTSSDLTTRDALIVISHDGLAVERTPLFPLMQKTASRLGAEVEATDRALKIRLPRSSG